LHLLAQRLGGHPPAAKLDAKPTDEIQDTAPDV